MLDTPGARWQQAPNTTRGIAMPMLRDNPVVKRLVETGEERMGKLAQQLLSNDKFVTALQGVVAKTISAKGTWDKGLRGALAAMNLPSTADVDGLKAKVDELERLLSSVESKLDSLLGNEKQ
jgi:hypothetical protein